MLNRANVNGGGDDDGRVIGFENELKMKDIVIKWS